MKNNGCLKVTILLKFEKEPTYVYETAIEKLQNEIN